MTRTMEPAMTVREVAVFWRFQCNDPVAWITHTQAWSHLQNRHKYS